MRLELKAVICTNIVKILILFNTLCEQNRRESVCPPTVISLQGVIFFERARASAEGDIDSGCEGSRSGRRKKNIYLFFPTPLRSRAFKCPAVSILFAISTNSRQNRGSVDRLAGNKLSDLLGIQSSVN